MVLSLVFFAIPLLALIPFSVVKILVLLPYLFWINIVGLPLAMLGVPYFEVQEFGAVPQGVAGYGLIALVYLLAALFLSRFGKL